MKGSPIIDSFTYLFGQFRKSVCEMRWYNMSNKNKKQIKEYSDLFYMACQNLEIRQLYNCIEQSLSEETIKNDVQLWEAAGVMEISLSEESGIDIEYLDGGFGAEEDLQFLEKNMVQSIYSIKSEKKNVNMVIKIFEPVLQELGGFICSDTDNFMPILAGKESMNG